MCSLHVFFSAVDGILETSLDFLQIHFGKGLLKHLHHKTACHVQSLLAVVIPVVLVRLPK